MPMEVIIINSLFVLVAVSATLMGIGLLWMAFKINEEEKQKEEQIKKANDDFRRRFDLTNLRD